MSLFHRSSVCSLSIRRTSASLSEVSHRKLRYVIPQSADIFVRLKAIYGLDMYLPLDHFSQQNMFSTLTPTTQMTASCHSVRLLTTTDGISLTDLIINNDEVVHRRQATHSTTPAAVITLWWRFINDRVKQHENIIICLIKKSNLLPWWWKLNITLLDILLI